MSFNQSIYPAFGSSYGLPNIADPMTVSSITVTIPWWDWVTGTIETRDVVCGFTRTGPAPADNPDNFDEAYTVLDSIWRDCLHWFSTNNPPDPDISRDFFFYDDGIQLDVAEGVVKVDIEFENIDPNIDQWFGTSGMRRLGLFAFTDDEQRNINQIQYLNFERQTFQTSVPAKGFRLWVFPGCSGSGQLFVPAKCPNLIYTGAISGVYP